MFIWLMMPLICVPRVKQRDCQHRMGLPQTVCAFVSGLSGKEIIVFVLPFKDDAWDTSTIFHHVRARACSLIMRRSNKKGRIRFRGQTAICDWRQKPTTTKITKGIFKLGLPLGIPSNEDVDALGRFTKHWRSLSCCQQTEQLLCFSRA